MAEYEEYEHVDLDGKRTTKKKSKGVSSVRSSEASNARGDGGTPLLYAFVEYSGS